MNKQQNTRLGFAQSRKTIAIFFLMFFAMQFCSPLALVTTRNAEAAGSCGPGGCGSSGSASAAGGLGGLLGGGGGGSMLEMVGMIMGLLMQLFQGGSTPQKGTAEENAGRLASGQERFTSGLQNPSSNSNTVNVYNPATIPSTSLLIGSGMTLQSNVQLKKGGAMTISNSNTTPTNIEIRNATGNTTATTTTINAGDTKVFRFNSAGTYKLCTGGTSTCGTSIVVAN